MSAEDSLMRALVEASGTQAPFQNDAEFRAVVVLMAETLLPAMMRGLAVEAAERADERWRAIRLLERGDLTPAVVSHDYSSDPETRHGL